MPLVPAKCTSCGGSLNVDSIHKKALCPYCGTAFMVEQAINNYNITNHNTFNMQGGTVIIGEDKRGELISAADNFLRLRMFESAEKNYRQVTTKYPDAAQGWLGLARSVTRNFDLGEWDREHGSNPEEWEEWKASLEKVQLWMKNAEQLGGPQEVQLYSEDYKQYTEVILRRVLQYEDMSGFYDQLQAQRSDCLAQKAIIQNKYTNAQRECRNKIQECENSISHLKLIGTPQWAAYLFPIVAMILFLITGQGFFVSLLYALIVRIVALPILMAIIRGINRSNNNKKMKKAREEENQKKKALQAEVDQLIDTFMFSFYNQVGAFNERWNGMAIEKEKIPGKSREGISDLAKGVDKKLEDLTDPVIFHTNDFADLD